MKETPSEWAGRNREQFLRSTKETLGKEMWFAVKINVIGTFLFAIGLMASLTNLVNWATGLLAATFLVFGVSLYWAWYIRRSQNRRWEKELAATAFANQRDKTQVRQPPDDLLTKKQPAPMEIDHRSDGPRRSFPA